MLAMQCDFSAKVWKPNKASCTMKSELALIRSSGTSCGRDGTALLQIEILYSSYILYEKQTLRESLNK